MSYIPGCLVRARLESVFLFKIILLPHVDDMASTIRVIFNIVNKILGEIPFSDSRTVALADRAVAYIPLIPPCDVIFIAQKIKVIGHIPVYPQEFSYRRLDRYRTKRDER